MKRTLLFVLALAVIPVGVDAQVTPSASCAYINIASPLEDVRSCAEQGDAGAQFALGFMYATGEGVLEDDVEAVRWYRLAAEQGLARLRVGVGRALPGEDLVRWVLSPMPREDEDRVTALLPELAEAVGVWVSEGVEPAMNRYNR